MPAVIKWNRTTTTTNRQTDRQTDLEFGFKFTWETHNSGGTCGLVWVAHDLTTNTVSVSWCGYEDVKHILKQDDLHVQGDTEINERKYWMAWKWWHKTLNSTDKHTGKQKNFKIPVLWCRKTAAINDIEIVKYCQNVFRFELPSVRLSRLKTRFLASYSSVDNSVCKHILIHGWPLCFCWYTYLIVLVLLCLFVCLSLYSLLPDLWWIKLFNVCTRWYLVTVAFRAPYKFAYTLCYKE